MSPATTPVILLIGGIILAVWILKRLLTGSFIVALVFGAVAVMSMAAGTHGLLLPHTFQSYSDTMLHIFEPLYVRATHAVAGIWSRYVTQHPL